MKRTIRIIAGAVLLAIAPLAGAADTSASPGQSRVAARLATSFTPLAGSEENARALVTALRNGTEVTLLTPPEGGTGDPVATTFAPPTRPMGWGNVSHALSLAQDSLARLGISNPTSAELQAALLGGEIAAPDGSTATLRGVLQMRADGMGWGNIAKASGTKMGAVVSSTKAMQGKVAAATTTAGSAPVGAAPKATGKAPSGITTAAGTGSAATVGKGPSKGITNASGVAAPAASRGIVTAEGGVSSHGRPGGSASSSGGGHAYGRGMVTASGASAGAGAATAAVHGHGQGLVSASGGAASPGAISTAAGPGNSNGNGNGRGQGNGKGKGG